MRVISKEICFIEERKCQSFKTLIKSLHELMLNMTLLFRLVFSLAPTKHISRVVDLIITHLSAMTPYT